MIDKLKKIKKRLQQLQDMRMIRKSGLFNAAVYLHSHPDVAQARIDPVKHYLQYGGFEGRDPSQNFSSQYYLDHNEDVRQSGLNPLVHYLKYGCQEGRAVLPPSQESGGDASQTSFLQKYLYEITINAFNDHKDNYDADRFGQKSKPSDGFKAASIVQRLLRRKNFIHLGSFSKKLMHALSMVEPFLPLFENVYRHLADEASRQWLVKLQAYRALGYRRVKLPTNTPDYWQGIAAQEKHAHRSDVITFPFGDLQFSLPLFDLRYMGVPLSLYIMPSTVHRQFNMGQYRLEVADNVIDVEQGDIVIDAGACWGETSLRFANQAGPSGCVYSFEFVDRNLEIFEKNMNLNPDLNESVKLIRRALWNKSDQSLTFSDHGPGTTIHADQLSPYSVNSITIDDFVKQRKLPHVDFIKMDIEGSELQALQGALETLKAHRPKLAISIYHLPPMDYVDIPEFLLSLDLGYRLYVRHYTIHAEETVLYAKVGNT